MLPRKVQAVILWCYILCVAKLSGEKLVLPLAVDLGEEERSDDVNVTLSSFQISPITSDDVLKVDTHNDTTSTDSEAEPDNSHTDEQLPPADSNYTDCDETNGNRTVDVDDIFVNASDADSLLTSCENPVTNVV